MDGKGTLFSLALLLGGDTGTPALGVQRDPDPVRVRVPDEQPPDLVRALAPGLRDEKDYEEGPDGRDGPKQEVAAVGLDGLLQVGLELGHQEGAGPVEHEGDGRAQGLGLWRVNLSVDGPGEGPKA